MNTSSATNNEQILLQAGEWLLELQSPDVPVERIAAWQQWLGSSERHARAFDQLQQTWSLADRLGEKARGSLPWATAEELQTPRSSEGVPRRPRLSARAARIGGLSLAATLLAVTAGSIFWLARDHSVMLIETAVGEHRDVRLSDSSVVSIGADSRLRIAMESDKRQVELERGEAYFQVAKDPHRPFSVAAGSASITAVGTAFNIRRTGESIVVGVSEGTVAVSPGQESILARAGIERGKSMRLTATTRLSAGQRLVLEPTLTAPKIEDVEARAIASWRAGRLQYAGEPLHVVIADVNRYLDEPIVIADRSVETLRVTGTVSEANIESWLTSLQTVLPVEITRGGSGRLEVRERDIH